VVEEMKRHLRRQALSLFSVFAALLLLLALSASAALAMSMPAGKGHHLLPLNPTAHPGETAIGVALGAGVILVALSMAFVSERRERRLVAAAPLAAARVSPPEKQESQQRKAA
jgi:hypothetical protein